MTVAKFFLRISGFVMLAGLTILLIHHSRRPTFSGFTMTQWLKILNSKPDSNENELRILHIINNVESGLVTVDVPLSYDLLIDHDFLGRNGQLDLTINGQACLISNRRASDGDCLFDFNNDSLDFGTNWIQMVFFIKNFSNRDRPLYAEGPISQFNSSNFCRIDHFFLDFTTNGLILYSKVAFSNASYNIELLSTDGFHIKTISGFTTNGIIDERWNLTDAQGAKYPYQSVKAVYRISCTNSLSQTLTQIYNIQSQ